MPIRVTQSSSRFSARPTQATQPLPNSHRRPRRPSMLWPNDADLASRDATLRHALELVLDDERLTQLVRSRHPDAGVQLITSNYVRYKPGTSCIVGFVARTTNDVALPGYAKASADEDSPQLFLLPNDAVLRG